MSTGAIYPPRRWDLSPTISLKKESAFLGSGLSHLEPSVSGLDEILIGGRWLAENELNSILLPERMATNLGINPQNPQGAVVSMWGMPFEVVGVFSGEKLQQRPDLDGEPLTPATFPREVTSAMTEGEAEAMESGDDVREFQSRYQHIPGNLTMIIPYRSLLAVGGHLKAVAIVPQTKISIQQEAQYLVDRFGLSLFSGEPDGTYLYHASDTMSYSGVPNIQHYYSHYHFGVYCFKHDDWQCL
jgi:hypothetical protein